jgi:hypothetical protein
VEAILKLSPPKTKRQLRHFLGMINYYRDMWQKRSHMLAPLTGLVSPLVKYKWGEEQQKAFAEIKQKVSQETLLIVHYLLARQSAIMRTQPWLAGQAQRQIGSAEDGLFSVLRTQQSLALINLGKSCFVSTHLLLPYLIRLS